MLIQFLNRNRYLSKFYITMYQAKLGLLHGAIVTESLFPTSLIVLLAVGMGPRHPLGAFSARPLLSNHHDHQEAGHEKCEGRSARLTGGSVQQISTRPRILLRKGRLWGRQRGRRRDRRRDTRLDAAAVGVSLAVSQLVVVRSENEAISKYTAAEILRNRGPGISHHEREDKMNISIVANMDPAATVSFYMFPDNEINNS